MPQSSNLTRRDFVNIVVGAVGTVIIVSVGVPAVAYVLGPGLKVSKSEAWIPLGTLESFPVGLPTLVTFTRTTVNGWERTTNSYGVYVTKQESGDIYVLSNVCTHLACRVTWKEDLAEYDCPCHEAVFDIEGLVVSGPPPKPLNRYNTKIEEDTLYIQL